MRKTEVVAAKGKKGKGKGKMCKVDYNAKAVEFLASRKGTVIQKGNLVNDLSKATKCSSRTAYRMVDTLIATNKVSKVNLIKIN
jgi:hypothetical protein